MFSTRMLARLLVSALGAMSIQTIVAEEPTAPPPPARSIREWNPNGTPAPAAPTPAAGMPVAAALPARSISEWRTTPGQPASPTMAPCPTTAPLAVASATPAANSHATPAAISATTTAAKLPAKPAARTGGSTSPISISLTSTLRQGNLVVILDEVPIFNETFQKPVLLISQTTRWDPLQIAPGKHRLSAKVYGTKKTYISATYDLDVSRTKGAGLRFVMKGDKLTVELAS